MKEDKRNRGFPNLDKYLKDRGRKLAKDANAIYRVKGRVLINIEIIDEYMETFHEFDD